MSDPLSASAATSAAPTALGVWLQACRVKSLAISSIAVLVGGAVAFSDGAWSARLLLAWLGAVALQAGTNLTNVSYNYKGARGGAFDARGSSAVVRAGLLAPERVRAGGRLCFALAIAVGLALTWLCGWPILALGILGLLAGYFYGAPPVRLAYLGLGVATVFLCMGPAMVIGAYYVVTGHVSAGVAAASIPVGLLAAGIMHTNDLRDYHTDVAHGKRTLSTRLGDRGARRALVVMVTMAYVAIVASVAARWLPWTTLIVALTLPRAAGLLRETWRARTTPELNDAWSLGVRLHGEFGMALVIGLLLAHVVPR
jgi:1,4-dihydroxy-2-naphthoate octaprenyltransferase